VYVNGVLIARDPSLTEPLSRGWITGQYYLASPPLLRQGNNELLVRVSGLAGFEPGLGAVMVGEPESIRVLYEHDLWKRLHVKIVSLALSLALGIIFVFLWLLRREEPTFGWFALSQLASAAYRYNQIAEDPWPFTSSAGWLAFDTAMKLGSIACWTLFLLRYGEQRYRTLERLMWLGCLVVLAVALWAPRWAGPQLEAWDIAGDMLFVASIAWFMWRTWQRPKADYRVLAACLVIPMCAAIYELLGMLGLVPGTHLVRVAYILTSLSIMFAAAYRFVVATRRIEAFNIKLKREVDAATSRLASTLAREHATELAKSRAEERLQLTRDLHDGFGGTLLGAIAGLEGRPETPAKGDLVELLKSMRDDLRLLIDSTAHERGTVAELLGPLRYRSSQLLGAAGIEARWHLQGLDDIELDGPRGLDMLRLLQEALTNVFKHSGATRVDVSLIHENGHLELCIRDDGNGLHEDRIAFPSERGGLANMRLRAQRIQGELNIESGPQGTELSLRFPLESAVRAGAAPTYS
jgi:signal transduction histidine kinase